MLKIVLIGAVLGVVVLSVAASLTPILLKPPRQAVAAQIAPQALPSPASLNFAPLPALLRHNENSDQMARP
jgi:hypothetical protein